MVCSARILAVPYPITPLISYNPWFSNSRFHRGKLKSNLKWRSMAKEPGSSSFSPPVDSDAADKNAAGYGVAVMELLCRKLPIDPSFEEGLLDVASWMKKILTETDDCFCGLDEEISFWDTEEQWKAMKLVDLALLCTEMVAHARPSMRDVVGTLVKLNRKSHRAVNSRED